MPTYSLIVPPRQHRHQLRRLPAAPRRRCVVRRRRARRLRGRRPERLRLEPPLDVSPTGPGPRP